jgi:hypothetical protein
MKRILLLLAAAALLDRPLCADDATPALSLKTETFDHDPAWDNSHNRVEASDPPTVKQDFGWSTGQIGGTVWKSTTPAWYGTPLEKPLSFKDGFSASGKIAVTRDGGKGGVAYLGFFNHERQGWRPWSSMAMRIVQDGDHAFIYLDYMTGKWQAGAAEMKLTIPADGSEHTWRLVYDPNATRAPWTDIALHDYLTKGRQTVDDLLVKARKAEPDVTRAALEQRLKAALEKGQVNFLARHGSEFWSLKQDKEELKGMVSVQVDDAPLYRTYLSAEMRDQPVTLDRFGIFNMQLYHGALNFHVTDLVVIDRKIDLSKDPGWTGLNNRTEFVERDFQRQNFGYSPDTNFAGGKKGEIGGQFYNVEPIDPLHGYYADEVGRLTLDDPIRFSGKITFIEGSTDAGMFFGFFRAEDEKAALPPNGAIAPGWPQPNVLGVVIDGPAKVGWYFAPVCTAAKRELSVDKAGPVFLPTREHRTFEFIYDPQANNGLGRITITLDGQAPFTLDLKPGQRTAGATFDHFGLMSFRRGGKYSTLYFDDLTYTTRRVAGAPAARHEQEITKVPYPAAGRKY